MPRFWWRKAILLVPVRFRRRRPDQTSQPAGPTCLNADQLRQFVFAILATRPNELNCDQCFDQVGCLAEAALAGQSGSAALSLAQDHLTRCQACREEYEALLGALGGFG